MKIKIVHISDFELNPTLQATRYTPFWSAFRKERKSNPNFKISEFEPNLKIKRTKPWKAFQEELKRNPNVRVSEFELGSPLEAIKYTPPWIGLQNELGMNPNFRRDTWNWLYNESIELLDRIKKNKKENEHQLLLISGDVVKGFVTKNEWVNNGWEKFFDKLKEVARGGTTIIVTTGSHDTHAIKNKYPFLTFYNSRPYSSYVGDVEAPWIVITNPSGERLDLYDNKISVIGYGDLDGKRGKRNKDKYDVGRQAFANERDDLSSRFVIGMSPDHRPGPTQWAGYNIYNYIATGGLEGHHPNDKDFFKWVNKHLIYSQQGRPFRCVGFGDPMWQKQWCSFTYGIVDTEKRIATFKDLSSDTPTDQFMVKGGHCINY